LKLFPGYISHAATDGGYMFNKTLK